MQKKHQRTLQAIFKNPTSANIKFKDIEGVFVALGAVISEREGSRIAVVLNGQVMVFHRPHPSPTTDKGAVVSIKKWLDGMGIRPNDGEDDDSEEAHHE